MCRVLRRCIYMRMGQLQMELRDGKRVMYQVFAGFKVYRKLCKVYRVLMEFTIFRGGKEAKVIVIANIDGDSPTACRIEALSQMQSDYLANKKRQQRIKNRALKL